MCNDPKHRLMVGIAINIPLNQSKRRASLRVAQAAVKASKWQLIDRRNQLLAELEGSRTLTLETLQFLELYRDELPPLAKDALEATIAVNSGLNVLPHRARCMWFIYTEYKHATR